MYELISYVVHLPTTTVQLQTYNCTYVYVRMQLYCTNVQYERLGRLSAPYRRLFEPPK